MTHPTSVERKSTRELLVSRAIDAPVSRVFAALTQPEEALDRSVAGMEGAMPEVFMQLDELLAAGTLG